MTSGSLYFRLLVVCATSLRSFAKVPTHSTGSGQASRGKGAREMGYPKAFEAADILRARLLGFVGADFVVDGAELQDFQFALAVG
jgi:hypothetical protein